MNSYVDGGAFARRTISAPCSAPGSPKSRVKFLCSHGGKIFPRPSDGQLKYVGGETRVISVPLDISFQELMKRVTYLIEGEMILKYQLVAEELDALVSVKCDEDVGHMLEEMEHYKLMQGYPRMRSFLFPINHLLMDHKLPRYIFSINGGSSACTCPTSPRRQLLQTTYMPKIQSSPSICNQYSYHLPPPYSSPFHTHNPALELDAASFLPDSAYNLVFSSSTGTSTGYYCSNCMHQQASTPSHDYSYNEIQRSKHI